MYKITNYSNFYDDEIETVFYSDSLSFKNDICQSFFVFERVPGDQYFVSSVEYFFGADVKLSNSLFSELTPILEYFGDDFSNIHIYRIKLLHKDTGYYFEIHFQDYFCSSDEIFSQLIPVPLSWFKK